MASNRNPAFSFSENVPPGRASLAFRIPHSTIRIRHGGIAQLVERQLCKLEVRGSNPLASSLRLQRSTERRLLDRGTSITAAAGAHFAKRQMARPLERVSLPD